MKQDQTLSRVPRILVVDDMPDNLFLMNGLFEDRYEIVQASSGREALEAIMSASPPDLILLDIMMPDMDGYEVLRRTRQHTPTAAIPIIFLTALASPRDQRLGLGLGAVDYLTKPVDPEMVVERVEAHMRATARSRLIEALSEKLARHLSPPAWETLFKGDEIGATRFEHQVQTVLYAEAGDPGTWGTMERDAFMAEVEWLAVLHGGSIDRFTHGAAVVFFDDAGPCIQLAMDLQRSAADMQVRMGIHTGMCDLATFASGHEVFRTLIGLETGAAAKMAATAATGSIAISPETYALVKEDIQSGGGLLLMEEFHDSDLAQVCLTPTPLRGATAMSTFAGLGMS